MTLSWDLFVILVFVVMGVYGFLIGKSRVFGIIMSAYVGLTIATQLGSYAFDYLSKITEISHSFNVTMFGAKLFVFVLVIFILMLNKELTGGGESSSSSFVTAIYGVLAAGLILSSVLSFMGYSERMLVFSASPTAIQVYNYQMIWLIAPIAMAITVTLWNKFRH